MTAQVVPVNTAEFIYQHLMQTTFDITVGGLISSQLNGRQDKSFDNGQGGVVSMDRWIVSQDITNKALDQCPV